MNVLFIHQNFPGQFRHIAAHGQAPIKLQICGLFDVELFGFSETMKAVVHRIILHFALLRKCAGTAVT